MCSTAVNEEPEIGADAVARNLADLIMEDQDGGMMHDDGWDDADDSPDSSQSAEPVAERASEAVAEAALAPNICSPTPKGSRATGNTWSAAAAAVGSDADHCKVCSV